MATTTPAPDLQLPSWPREQMQPVMRMEYERAYPEGSPLRVASYPMLPIRPFPMGADAWPPMRDALADTLDFLAAVAHDLAVRGLHCLEVTVTHETGPSTKDAIEQGWQYRAVVLAVPTAVAQQQRLVFEQARAKADQPASVN